MGSEMCIRDRISGLFKSTHGTSIEIIVGTRKYRGLTNWLLSAAGVGLKASVGKEWQISSTPQYGQNLHEIVLGSLYFVQILFH